MVAFDILTISKSIPLTLTDESRAKDLVEMLRSQGLWLCGRMKRVAEGDEAGHFLLGC